MNKFGVFVIFLAGALVGFSDAGECRWRRAFNANAFTSSLQCHLFLVLVFADTMFFRMR